MKKKVDELKRIVNLFSPWIEEQNIYKNISRDPFVKEWVVEEKMSIDYILGRSKQTDIVCVRDCIIFYLFNNLMNTSMTIIGKAFNRDTSSIRHSRKKVILQKKYNDKKHLSVYTSLVKFIEESNIEWEINNFNLTKFEVVPTPEETFVTEEDINRVLKLLKRRVTPNVLYFVEESCKIHLARKAMGVK